MSEVVRDAVRRLQEDEAVKSARTRLADFEAGLTRGEREGIRRGVRQGIKDIEEGRYQEYDAGEGVALRIATGILETIITLSSQPRVGVPAEQFGEGVRKVAAGLGEAKP